MFPMIIKDEDGNLKEVIKDEDKVTNEVVVKHVLLLTRDKDTLPVTKLDCDRAIEVLKEGKYTIRPGAGPKEKWGQIGFEPFYNPYPPELDKEKQEKFFRKLFNSGVSFYLLNTGSFKKIEIMPHQTHMYIRHIIGI